jgi:predicted ATPase
MNAITTLTIKGFKSIRTLEQFELRPLNVLIGANGSGKSNFVAYFRMLQELLEQRLQRWVAKQGGADRLLSFGVKETGQLETRITFAQQAYHLILEPTAEDAFTFVDEILYDDSAETPSLRSLGAGHMESKLKNELAEGASQHIAEVCDKAIAGWKIFHLHDTSDTAGVKRLGALHDNAYLRPDASNLAAFLYRLAQEHPHSYQQIRKVIQLAIPFFDDFVLKPQKLPTAEEQIRLLWKQQESDYPFWPSQLSDGSLRFICLATALLQPQPPSTIIIDEPELGLHPCAIALLASLLRSASKRMQVIVSTQAVALVNEFSIDDLIVVEREAGATIFKRHQEAVFQGWLEEYSVGELWEKNILGGGIGDHPSRMPII